MIISPPFLPPKTTGETEDAWIARAMSGGEQAGQGMFPLSADAGWHGGLHLTAPAVEGHPDQHEAVRAIADGTVVYRRAPTPVNLDLTFPLNYHSPHNTPQWTHDGLVVIRHETEIGEGANAQITYFSITQHLSALDEHLPVLNQRIWRKDKIGTAGSIFGEPNRIHFEIVATEEQVQRICGRVAPTLSTASDGRTDAIYGDVYVKLPSGTQWKGEVLFRDDRHPNRNAAGDPMPGAAIYTSTQDLYVGIRYDRGECTLTTYDENGVVIGQFVEPHRAEYNLYNTATARYPGCPSAGYELLRFGRVIGPDALSPAGAAHWRQVPYPGALGWVNLNADGLHKFSDADMPHWRGWQLVNDDSDGDVRCDSALILGLLRRSAPDLQAKDTLGWLAAMADEASRARLRRLVCKVPSEWADDDATIDQRYGWLKTLPEHERLEEDDYVRFKAFVKKLGFLSTAGLPGLAVEHWHFNPREFVRQFRRCGWLSALEFAQCFPRRYQYLNGTTFRSATKSWAEVLPVATLWTIPFNRANRRYGVDEAKQRLVHYFSHVIPETDFLALVKESDDRLGTYLRGKAYWPYYGRGLIQLTWLETYRKYGKFRRFARTVQSGTYADLGWSPDEMIALNNSNYNAFNCADSACFYLASYSGMLRTMDAGISQNDAIAVSRCVNGQVAIQNLNGLDIRLQSILFLRDVLLDGSAGSATEEMSFSWRRNSQTEPTGELDNKGRPKRRYFLRDAPWVINVSLEKQRP